jgi:hypothetical protein
VSAPVRPAPSGFSGCRSFEGRYDRCDMGDPGSAVMDRIRELVDEHRATCLWYLREDWLPRTESEALQALDAIARNGDLSAFQKAAELRTWLSRASNSTSAA